MTDREWDALAALLDEGWKGDFTDEKAEVYRVLLDDYSAKQLLAAVKKLVRNGKPFLPAAAEIAGAIEEDVSWPSWSEWWSTSQVALTLHPDERALAEFEALHPAARAFVEHEGLARLRAEPFHDPDYGALRIKDLEGRWDEFSERVQVRLRSGMELEQAVGRPALERGGGLKRLDPGSQLEVEKGMA